MKPRLEPISARDQRHLNAGSSGVWDAIQTVIIGVDEVATTMERRWGVGRLIRLVSDDTRARFQRGHTLWNAAISASNLEQVRNLGPKIIQAWTVMDREAAALGHEHLIPEAWEALQADGSVLVVCPTSEAAHAHNAAGRRCVVYTVQELARLLPQLDLLNEIKSVFDGALVSKVTTHSPEFAGDWAAGSAFLDLHEMEEV